jgi:hypothetical protein
MDFLVGLHSGIRWLVIVVWVVVVARYLLAWLLSPNKYTSFDRIIYTALNGLVDLNVLIGLTLIVLKLIDGTSQLEYWFHMALMLFAAVVLHMASQHIKTLTDNEPKEKFFIGWAAALFAGLLIIIGLSFVGAMVV